MVFFFLSITTIKNIHKNKIMKNKEEKVVSCRRRRRKKMMENVLRRFLFRNTKCFSLNSMVNSKTNRDQAAEISIWIKMTPHPHQDTHTHTHSYTRTHARTHTHTHARTRIHSPERERERERERCPPTPKLACASHNKYAYSDNVPDSIRVK